jgi:hypothetical protein
MVNMFSYMSISLTIKNLAFCVFYNNIMHIVLYSFKTVRNALDYNLDSFIRNLIYLTNRPVHVKAKACWSSGNTMDSHSGAYRFESRQLLTEEHVTSSGKMFIHVCSGQLSLSSLRGR